MKYFDYEIDSAFIRPDGKIDWKITGNGAYVIGKSGSTEYFIKRNLNVRYPDKTLPAPVFEAYKKSAELVEKKQKVLSTKMKSLSTKTDRIVKEVKNFWDKDDGMFVTVTEYTPGALPDDFDYTVLSSASFIGLCRDFAERVKILHSCGVIHGDFKEKNVLVAKGGADSYYTYLIDFDTAFTLDTRPALGNACGTDKYQSPELLAFAAEIVDSDVLTSATDIFTMAIVMHRWWTNEFPKCDDDKLQTGEAVYLDKSLNLSKKFDLRIGANCGATLISLMNWMLQKDTAKRPTADEVYAVLNDEISVPDEYQIGSDVSPFDENPWGIHVLAIEILPPDELKALGVKSFAKVNVGGGHSGYRYKVVLSGGEEKTLGMDELVDAGYARRRPAVIEEPWPEHDIEFLSPEEISKMGYSRIVPVELFFRKRYLITMTSGLEMDKSCDWLILEGLAHPKPVGDVDVDTPWPEHGTQYVAENMKRLKIKSITRSEIGGEHRYKLVYDIMVDGAPKVNDRVAANNMKLMGLIK